jgi:hypothetical protein
LEDRVGKIWMEERLMRGFRAVRAVLLALLISAVPASSFAAIAVSITVAPPVLPVVVQPPCPVDGYLWTPGYWAWGPAGYYWVGGAWIAPPSVGLLWTPGYWGFGGGIYLWHAGYWGPHVGFYGGVNYGFGYGGVGFVGGRWMGGHFAYNTAVMHVNTRVIHNTYVDRTVVRNTGANRTSFNGRGGLSARPNAADAAASRDRHIAATSAQMSHEHQAGTNRANFASVNRGRPAGPAARPAGNVGRAAGPAARPAGNAGRPAGPAARPAGGNMNRPAGNNGRQAGPAPQARPESHGGGGGGGGEHRGGGGGGGGDHGPR